MDRNTFSHYGWIIVVALVLLALLMTATPMGKFIGKGALSIYLGFKDTNDSILDKDHVADKEDKWEDMLFDGEEFRAIFVTSGGKWKSDGSTENKIVKYTKDTELLAPDLISKNGSDFLGWQVTKVGNEGNWNQELFNNKDQKKLFGKAGKMGNVTFTAMWNDNAYNAIFNPNGGTWSNNRKDSLNSAYTINDVLVAPAQLNKVGYQFSGWKVTASNGNWNKDKIFMNETSTDVAKANGFYGNVTLTAQWKPIHYTIEYTYNGGSKGPEAPKEAVFDKTLLISNPVKKGYTFMGWEITGMDDACKHIIGKQEFKTDKINKIKETAFKNLRATPGAVKFKAIWNSGSYSITYDLNKGNSSTTPKIPSTPPSIALVDEGFEISIPSKPGYDFTGWTITGMDSGEHFYGTSDKNFKKTSSKTITTSANTTWFKNLSKQGGVVKFKANWTPKNYTMTYNGNHGINNGKNSFTETVKFDSTYKVHLNTFQRTGYTFVNWNGKHGSWNPGKTFRWEFQENVTVDAQWSANIYKIEYDLNKGNSSTTPAFGSHKVTSTAYDQTITIDNPSKVGYTFTGWTITGMDDGVTHYFGNEKTTSNNISLTKATTFKNLHANKGTVKFKANWKANVYTVTYDGTGGKSNGQPTIKDKVTFDTHYKVKENSFARIGYTFKTWNNSQGIWNPNKAFNWTFTNDITLKAQWIPHVYNITYDIYGDTHGISPNAGTHHPSKATYDEVITVDIPTEEKYLFQGWNITGMDNITHYFGSSTSTNSSANKVMETKFKNLHSHSGTVHFSATWRIKHIHKYVSKTTSPDCTHDGYITYTCVGQYIEYCNRPTYTVPGTPALGHDWAPATCTQPSTCRRCGLTRGSSLGHNMVSNNDYSAPTCTSSGHNTSYTCSRCGHTTGGSSISALGHSMYSVSGTSPTCTSSGQYGGQRCSRCSYSTGFGYRPALGHSMYSISGTSPTCTSSGRYSGQRCSRCSYSTGGGYRPALGHNSYSVAANSPTCTKSGNYAGTKCSRCGATLSGCGYRSALGHDEYPVFGKSPTCTEYGYSQYYTCSRCSWTDGYRQISPTGHSWKAATCTYPMMCRKCGQTSGSKLGHNYKKHEFSHGQWHYVCSRCGSSYWAG